MKFGKLPDISHIQFKLPLVNPQTLDLLGRRLSPNGFRAYVGLPRWSSKEWVGNLYPKGTKQGDYLNYYSQSFNCIELNTTHYRIPTGEQVSAWRDSVGEGFHFCPKIPQVISHYRKLVNAEAELRQFTEAIRLFGDNLGCSFIQLHESFSPSLLQNLQQFVAAWPGDLPLSIEFRHEDWFQNRQLIPQVMDLLLAYHIAPVITDVAGRRDVLHTSLTNRTAVLRFVGNALHPTDYQRVDAWIDRIGVWVKNGLERLYFFVHEPGDALASELGTYVIGKLNGRFELGLKRPGLPRSSGSQMSLFE